MSDRHKITVYTSKDNSPIISIIHEYDESYLGCDVKLSCEEFFSQPDKLHVSLEYNDDTYHAKYIDLSIGEAKMLVNTLSQWLRGK